MGATGEQQRFHGSACVGAGKCLRFAKQPEVTTVQTAVIVNAKPLPPSMKGYELYSWYDEGGKSWRYTLITGTNRLKAVEEALVRYFSLLNEGQYGEAVALHGGGYEVLRDWNPTADADDVVSLYRRGSDRWVCSAGAAALCALTGLVAQ